MFEEICPTCGLPSGCLTRHHKIDMLTARIISYNLLKRGVLKSPILIHELGGSDFICRECHDKKHGVAHTHSRRMGRRRAKFQALIVHSRSEKREDYLAYARQWQKERLF